MPNTCLSLSLSVSLSPSPSLLPTPLLSLSLSLFVHLFLKKQNYNTLLFLTFIKSSFLLFLEKRRLGTYKTFLYLTRWYNEIHTLYLISQGKNPKLLRM